MVGGITNKRRLEARRRHNEWLRLRGITRPSKRDSAKWREAYAESMRTAPPARCGQTPSTLGGGADATADRSLMKRLHLEPPHVRAEILRKAAMVAPAFNKGGLQYVPDT
jgi:hypothetical protein